MVAGESAQLGEVSALLLPVEAGEGMLVPHELVFHFEQVVLRFLGEGERRVSSDELFDLGQFLPGADVPFAVLFAQFLVDVVRGIGEGALNEGGLTSHSA